MKLSSGKSGGRLAATAGIMLKVNLKKEKRNMSNEKELPNGMKIVFAPGCFDSFEGTQEELDELLKEIEEAFVSGEAFENAISLDEMEDEDLADLLEALEGSEKKLLQ